MQFGTSLRNARADVIESHIGTSPVLRILSGTPPANPAAAETGTLLAEITLPSDWAGAASGGVKTLLGTWQDAAANNNGTATYFRIYNSGVTTCHIQGSVGTIGTDMIVDSVTFSVGQPFTITAFTTTEGNA